MQISSHSYRRTPSRYYFGCAEFCPETLELSVLGETVALERRPLRLLHVLLQHVDRVVGHEVLLHDVWDGRVTVKNVLPNAMTKLRKALGRDAKLIVTIPGVGYRLNGPVQFDSAESSTVSVSQSSVGRPTATASAALDVVPLRFTELLPDSSPAAEQQPGDAARAGDTASAGLLHRISLPKRLEAFRQFAEGVGRRHATDEGGAQINHVDMNLFADGRLVLLARRHSSNSSVHKAEASFYRAPELYRGHAESERSDLYALGVLLYQMCCADAGRPLLSDWPQDVLDDRCRLLIETATRADPIRRPASVAQWLALSELDGSTHTPASAWQRMLGLPVKLSRRSGV
jgi:DNA-binding winged helix-turn-helix (wHTH) protein